MRDWLTIELVLGMLLVTSFTCVGLVALWAATSPRHWFIRTSILVAVLSPLLAVPAYEPFLVFALQACVIVAGVQIWPWAKRLGTRYVPTVQVSRAERNRSHPLRFAIRMLLIATPAVAVLALLSPIVDLPYAPIAVCVVFALEACVILTGALFWCLVMGVRIRLAPRPIALAAERARPPRAIRFSLKTLLLLTPVIAVIVAIAVQIAVHMPAQGREGWTTIALNGIVAGAVVLLAAWMVVTRHRSTVWPAAIALTLALALILAWNDWLVAAFTASVGWPPSQATLTILGPMRETHPQLAWFGVLPAILVSLLALLIVWRVGMATAVTAAPQRRDDGLPRRRWARVAARTTFAIAFIALAVFPIAVLWELLHPLPIPDIAMPEPNGFDDVIVAGEAFSLSPILSTSVEPNSTAQLAAEVAKYATAYEQLRRGLGREIRVRPWPKDDDLMAAFDRSIDSIQQARSAARGLMREAQLAQQQKQFHDAARISFDNIRLGLAIPRDGLLVDYFVGSAVEGGGNETLYHTIGHLDADQCRAKIAALYDVDQNREPVRDVLYRDRIWTQHAYGWYGRLSLMLSPDVWFSLLDAEEVEHRAQAFTRLLIVELALRAYSLKHGIPPDRLDELVPEFLETIPIDSYDPTGAPLRYVRTEDGYLLYSVGVNGHDDQGEATEWYSGVPGGDGDLRLDVYFAPRPVTPARNADATSAGAGSDTAESDAAVDNGEE